MENGTLLAAVDLGSNSFRLEIGRYDSGHIERVEYLKETVRQGSGLDEHKNLSLVAMERGWECLARFAERLQGFQKHQVRAVATQTLREARNRDDFVRKAQQVLGFGIEVVSGHEEARLIYQGVSRLLPQSDERRLVVDIGGRSTELILGQGFGARQMESFRLGSVAWSTRYFPHGQLTAAHMQTADTPGRHEPGTGEINYAWLFRYIDQLGYDGWIGCEYKPAAGTREGLVWIKALAG